MNAPNQLKAAIYARVSSEQQVQANTIDSQVAALPSLPETKEGIHTVGGSAGTSEDYSSIATFSNAAAMATKDSASIRVQE